MTRTRIIRLFILLLGFLSAYPAFSAQLPLHITGIIVPDTNASYTAEHVLDLYQQKDRQPLPQASRVRAKVNWIVSEINNPDTDTEWVINLSSTVINYVDLYIFENDKLLDHRRTGNSVVELETLFNTHFGYIFDINVAQHRKLHVLIRTETGVYYNIGAWAQPEQEFWQYSNKNTILIILSTGMIIGLILYNLLLANSLKDLNYLWYSLHALGYLLFFINTHSFYIGVTPYLADLVGIPDVFANGSKISHLINNILLIDIQLFGALFCYRFLKIADMFPLLKRLFQLFFLGVALEVLIFPFIPYIQFAFITQVWLIVLTPLVVFSSIIAVINKVSQAGYMLVGWTIMLISNSLSLLEIMGELDYSLYTALRSSVATAVEMMIFSLALADRVRALINDKSAAEEASRAKSEFLAIMSHEIRTPLYGVLGTTKLIRQTHLDTQQQEYLQSIEYSGQTLLAVIDEILDFSKLEADAVELEIHPFNLQCLLHSIIAQLQARADEKGLDLGCSIDEKIANSVCGDSNRIRQILLNLLSNAIKFTDQGQVILSVSLVVATEQYMSIKFSVSDTGIGIPSAQKAHIFHHFTQADSSITRRYGGTGMGLAIVKKLIIKMHGSIDFTSEPEQGTCFFFTLNLPIGEVQATTPTEIESEETEVNPEPQGYFNFLLVDDIELNRTITQELLCFEGHSVTTVKTGKQALVELSAQNFDLILMDIRMPDMDGRAVTRRLRARQDNTPIIGFTASVMPDERARCLESGMNAVLAKPLNLSALNCILRDLFDSGMLIKHAKTDNNLLLQHRKKLGNKKVSALLKIYRHSALKHLQIINKAIQNNNNPLIIDNAHILAGMAGSMGFFEVSALASNLESLAANSRKSELTECLADLQNSYIASLESIETKNVE